MAVSDNGSIVHARVLSMCGCSGFRLRPYEVVRVGAVLVLSSAIRRHCFQLYSGTQGLDQSLHPVNLSSLPRNSDQ